MKGTLQLNFCCLYTSGQVCRFKTVQSSQPSVPLKGKYTKSCGLVSVAVAVGLLMGWTLLELHQHTVSCVAEATETVECRDNKEQISQQCRVMSLMEAIDESDHLLQRVKVRWKTNSSNVYAILSDHYGCALC